MSRRRRPEVAAEARRRNQEQLARAGRELRESRVRRRLTQQRLADQIGVSQASISAMERGQGGSFSVDLWQHAFTSLDRRLVVEAARDFLAEPLDAGHLVLQELVLRLGRAAGFRGAFELPSWPSNPARSTDVALRDDRRRLIVLVECWNSIDDIGASARSTSRKVTDVEGHAAALGLAGYRVAACWVVRATGRNRSLVARYPEVFAARFPGSSLRWADALESGADPPHEPGLIWAEVAGRRIHAWRRR